MSGFARTSEEIRRRGRHGRLLHIHEPDDTAVPVDNEPRLAAATGGTLWIVNGAGHVGAYADDPVEYLNRVSDFLAASVHQ